MSTSTSLDWMADEGLKLANCLHSDPFSILGPQPISKKWVVRAWVPEANKVELLLDGRKTVMQNEGHKWIFDQISQWPALNKWAGLK